MRSRMKCMHSVVPCWCIQIFTLPCVLKFRGRYNETLPQEWRNLWHHHLSKQEYEWTPLRRPVGGLCDS